MLIVVARFQRVNEACFEPTPLLAVNWRVRDEIEISGTVTCSIERVCCAASISSPEIVALADPQQVFLAIGLHIDAWSCAKCLARLKEAGEALERESHHG